MQIVVISRRRAVAASLALALISVVAACGGGTAAGVDPTGSIVIDVRSPEEFAVDQMRSAGFVDLLDLGSVEDAAPVTGLQIVR